MNKKSHKTWIITTNTQRRSDELKDTIKGFLIMTDKNKEKICIKDAYNILNDAIDEIYSFSSLQIDQSTITNNPIDTTEDKPIQVAESLEKELKQMKSKKNYFYNFDTHCNGVVFIKLAKEFETKIDPMKLSKHIMNKVLQSKESLSRCISRFYPIEIAMKAKYDTFKEEAPHVLEKYFSRKGKDEDGVERPKRSWKLELRTRNNNSISKEFFMNYVSQFIGKEHFYVDFKTPELTVLIEITNDMLCLSVLENYYEYKCYNIHSLTKTEEERSTERKKLMEMQSRKIIIKDNAIAEDEVNKKDNDANNGNDDHEKEKEEKCIESIGEVLPQEAEEEEEEEIDII